MARVIEEWSLPNDGFKFRHNPPDGCGDMGANVGGLGGGYREVVAVYLVRLYVPRMGILVYVEMYCKKDGDFALAAWHATDKNYVCRVPCAASAFAARGTQHTFAARLIRMGLSVPTLSQRPNVDPIPLDWDNVRLTTFLKKKDIKVGLGEDPFWNTISSKGTVDEFTSPNICYLYFRS